MNFNEDDKLIESFFKRIKGDPVRERQFNRLVEIARFEVATYGEVQDEDYYVNELEKIVFGGENENL